MTNPYAPPQSDLAQMAPAAVGGGVLPRVPYTPEGTMRLYWWGMGLTVSMIGALVGVILLMIVQYRAWRMIQSMRPRTTPGRAVGFQFIPFFNLYWAFVAYPGLAKDMNTFNKRHGVSQARVSEGMGLAIALVMLGQFLLALISGVIQGAMYLSREPITDALSNAASLVVLVLALVFLHRVARITADLIRASR